jgi:hypothetical protein
MEVELTAKKVKASTQSRECVFRDKKYWVNSGVKAKHIVQLERYESGCGDVERGLRLVAMLLQEAMMTEALSFEDLLEYEITELEPILKLIS